MKNAKLVIPSVEYLDSYLAACVEMEEVPYTGFMFSKSDEFDIWKTTLFEKYEKYRKGIDLPEGFVPSSAFWLVEDGEFIGMGDIRHSLTPALERYGGHIGYGIRPSKWNKGYGSFQLKLLLEEAAKLGISEALITCNLENIGSAKVIENNGGKLIDVIDNVVEGKELKTCRYHVKTI